MLRRVAVLALSIGAASCAGRSDLVRWEDVDKTRGPPTQERREIDEPRLEKKARAAPPPVPTPPPAPPTAPPRLAPLTPMLINGARVEDGALTDVAALELACLADARALVEPARALARLAESGQKVGATLGSFAFVVLERDPARSLTDPPPLACRPLQGGASLQAPLSRKREPAARWLVRRARDGVAADSAALLADCDRRGLVPAGRPRVIVDEAGALVALAVPVTGGS